MKSGNQVPGREPDRGLHPEQWIGFLRKLRPRSSLRLKSIVFTAALVIFIVLAYSLFFMWEERAALRKEKELRTATILENFVELNREPLILNDRITLETSTHRVIKNEDIVYALILSTTGDEYFATSLEGGDQTLARVKDLGPASDLSPRTFTRENETLLDFSRSLVINDKLLGVFHIGLSEQGINEILRKARNKMLVVSLPLLLVFLALTGYLVTLAVKPIEQITAHARTLGQGNLESRLALARSDEIGELAATLDKMAEEIQAAEQELVEKERMARELEIARLMQTRLLPAILPEIPNLEIASLFSPAYEVSGDFYDCFPLGDGQFGVVVADVAGKGLKGAWIASITRTTLKTILAEETQQARSPKKILTRLNTLLKPDLERAIFVTLAYMLIDTTKDQFRFASAGHPDILQFGESGIEEIRSWGPALGAVDEFTFEKITEEKTLTLKPGEGFLLYTDGLTEARNSSKQEFGLERVKEELSLHTGLGAREIPPKLFAEVREFCGPKELDDDVTVVVIKRS